MTMRSAVSVLAGVLVLTLVAPFNLESNSSVIQKTERIRISPTAVDSDLWHNKHAALIQDVDGDGIYQNFSVTNSAFLVFPNEDADATETETSSQASESNVVDDDVVDTNDAVGDTVPNDADGTGDETSSESDNQTNVESASGDPISEVTGGVGSFTRAVRTMLLAAETVITENDTTQDAVPEAVTTEITTESSEPVAENVSETSSEDETAIDANAASDIEEEDSEDSNSAETIAADSNATHELSSVPATPKDSAILFSGFDVPNLPPTIS